MLTENAIRRVIFLALAGILDPGRSKSLAETTSGGAAAQSSVVNIGVSKQSGFSGAAGTHTAVASSGLSDEVLLQKVVADPATEPKSNYICSECSCSSCSSCSSCDTSSCTCGGD